MEALLTNGRSTAGRAPGGSGCHGPLVPGDEDGSPLRWYGVCFGVAEQEEGPHGSVRWMGPFRARLLAGQTRRDAHGEKKQRRSRTSSSSSRACRFQASSSRPSSPSHTAKVEVMPKMMVLQTRRLRIHGYRDGVYTLCRQWKCGTRENPMLDAVFTDEWQQKCVFPTTSSAPPQEIEEASSPSSSSSSSS